MFKTPSQTWLARSLLRHAINSSTNAHLLKTTQRFLRYSTRTWPDPHGTEHTVNPPKKLGCDVSVSRGGYVYWVDWWIRVWVRAHRHRHTIRLQWRHGPPKGWEEELHAWVLRSRINHGCQVHDESPVVAVGCGFTATVCAAMLFIKIYVDETCALCVRARGPKEFMKGNSCTLLFCFIVFSRESVTFHRLVGIGHRK